MKELPNCRATDMSIRRFVTGIKIVQANAKEISDLDERSQYVEEGYTVLAAKFRTTILSNNIKAKITPHSFFKDMKLLNKVMPPKGGLGFNILFRAKVRKMDEMKTFIIQGYVDPTTHFKGDPRNRLQNNVGAVASKRMGQALREILFSSGGEEIKLDWDEVNRLKTTEQITGEDPQYRPAPAILKRDWSAQLKIDEGAGGFVVTVGESVSPV